MCAKLYRLLLRAMGKRDNFNLSLYDRYRVPPTTLSNRFHSLDSYQVTEMATASGKIRTPLEDNYRFDADDGLVIRKPSIASSRSAYIKTILILILVMVLLLFLMVLGFSYYMGVGTHIRLAIMGYSQSINVSEGGFTLTQFGPHATSTAATASSSSSSSPPSTSSPSSQSSVANYEESNFDDDDDETVMVDEEEKRDEMEIGGGGGETFSSKAPSSPASTSQSVMMIISSTSTSTEPPSTKTSTSPPPPSSSSKPAIEVQSSPASPSPIKDEAAKQTTPVADEAPVAAVPDPLNVRPGTTHFSYSYEYVDRTSIEFTPYNQSRPSRPPSSTDRGVVKQPLNMAVPIINDTGGRDVGDSDANAPPSGADEDDYPPNWEDDERSGGNSTDAYDEEEMGPDPPGYGKAAIWVISAHVEDKDDGYTDDESDTYVQIYVRNNGTRSGKPSSLIGLDFVQ